MPPAEILHLLSLGLLLWALGATIAAWRWRRAYLEALKQYRFLLTTAAPRPARPAKSLPHVKAAKTRSDRARAKVMETCRKLQADILARELGW